MKKKDTEVSDELKISQFLYSLSVPIVTEISSTIVPKLLPLICNIPPTVGPTAGEIPWTWGAK